MIYHRVVSVVWSSALTLLEYYYGTEYFNSWSVISSLLKIYSSKDFMWRWGSSTSLACKNFFEYITITPFRFIQSHLPGSVPSITGYNTHPSIVSNATISVSNYFAISLFSRTLCVANTWKSFSDLKLSFYCVLWSFKSHFALHYVPK